MSARVPFVPQRPAATSQAQRVPSAQSDQNVDTAAQHAHDTFRTTGLLSSSASNSAEHSSDTSNGSGIAQSKNQSKPGADSPDPSALNSGINKPLNLSGLVKKPRTQPAPLGGVSNKTRKSFEDPAARARSPFAQAQTLRAPRPSSPFFPTTSAGFVPVSSFRVPAAPAPATDAHIPASAAGAGAEEEAQRTGEDTRGHARMRPSSHPSLEKIHETAEGEELEPYRTFNDGRAHVPPRAGSYDNNGGTLRHTASKRAQLEDEDEDNLEYGGGAKRYKPDAGVTEFAPPYSRHAAPAPMGYPPAMGGGDTAFVPPYTQAPPAAPVHALQRLLGQELDVYVDAHVDSYEQAKKKWAERSVEEWTAGADEITGKFTKMLDFVKDHMTSKLTLYASLHSTVAAHRATLSDRDKILVDARESLVREGGAVVGGGAAMTVVGDQDKGEN